MPQDNLPEQEAVNSKQEAEETAETRPDFEIQESKTENREQEIAKPKIPESTKPRIPQEEAMPTGGPGDQQTQTTTQTQTKEQATKERVNKIKGQLKRPIPINTPAERKVSGEIEDKHNQDVLNKP